MARITAPGSVDRVAGVHLDMLFDIQGQEILQIAWSRVGEVSLQLITLG
jgi:hypothetical protein